MSQSNLLGPLVEAIETVRRRIQEHGSSLRENETRTRVALIDPILQALGWDVSNPEVVTPEFPVASSRADYGLLIGGRAVIALEAKRLGEGLESHRQQMVNYANTAGVAYAGLTNGDEWELYRVFSATPLPIDDRRVLRVRLSESASEAVALKLLLLWRPNISSGQPAEAETPVVEMPTENSEPEQPVTPVSPLSPPDEGSWVPINSVYSLNGTKVKPSAIKFSDGQSTSIRNWHDVWKEFGRYVHANNLLDGKTLLLRSPAFKKPILGSTSFSESCIQVDNLPVFVEWAANTFRKLRWTEYLAKQLGVGTISIRVRSQS